MAIFKCKMCGGDIEIIEGTTVAECLYCGTKQTVPDVNDEKRINLFNRANRLRMNSEFDKAGAIYEQIIAEFPEEAEAYWGLCLCNYGIEYVDDPATAAKIPTVHRASFEKLRKDENYELALEYADTDARIVYQEQAKEIDRIMGEILSISSSEKPYDIFICYKETDNSGGRTPDSVIAQDIYDELTKKGYKVFFSRITLEDKLGQQYEPYIFAALNSAKLMLAIGTDYEYYNAVWVKNEWSRFLKLMAKDKSKMLIPCFKDMDAYDMPEQFKGLQAQDMGKLGFIQDLLRGIDKIFGRENQPQTANAAAQNTAAQSNPTVRSILERAVFFLEDKDFESADTYADKVLDIEPANADAYLIKLLSQYKASNIEEFSKHFYAPWEIDENANTVTVLSFKDDYGFIEIKYFSEIIGADYWTASDIVKKLPYKIPVRISDISVRLLERNGFKLDVVDERSIYSLNILKNNRNYQKIERFGNSVQKENLRRAVSAIIERHCEMLCGILEKIEFKEKQERGWTKSDNSADPEKYAAYLEAYSDASCINKAREIFDCKINKRTYDRASQMAASAKNAKEFESAAAEFEKIPGFKDADAHAADCREKAEEARLEAEREKEAFELKVDSVAAALKKSAAKSGQQNLEKQLAGLQKLLDGFDAAKERLSELKTEAAALQKECDELPGKIASLGIFKKKEKSALSAELLQVNAELETVKKECAEIEACYSEFGTKDKLTAAINAKQAELEEQTGGYASLGSYPQTADGTKMPIEWLVLERTEKQVLLISRYALDCKKYNDTKSNVTWESCSLRRWLNGEFLNTAFTPAQQSLIALSDVSADKNPKNSTNPGKATKDKIFLLSINEAEKYFKTDEARRCAPTAYSKAHGADTSTEYKTTDGEAACWWWLRSPGNFWDDAAVVYGDGSVGCYGHRVNCGDDAVRPALRINLDS